MIVDPLLTVLLTGVVAYAVFVGCWSLFRLIDLLAQTTRGDGR